MYITMARHFPIPYFFGGVALSDFKCISASHSFMYPCNSFFHSIYPFGLSDMLYFVSIFYSKIVFIPFYKVVGFWWALFNYLLTDFFFRNTLFCLYSLTLTRYHLNVLSFANIFSLYVTLRRLIKSNLADI